MIPDFTSDGVLPPGIHTTTLGEFERRFSVFDRSDRRKKLFVKLNRLVQEAQKSGIAKRILIAGSFVTDKPEPNDFDCVLVLDPVVLDKSLPPYQYNLVSRKMARRIFGGDVMPALVGSKALAEYIEFFQTTRDGHSMGIVEIEL